MSHTQPNSTLIPNLAQSLYSNCPLQPQPHQPLFPKPVYYHTPYLLSVVPCTTISHHHILLITCAIPPLVHHFNHPQGANIHFSIVLTYSCLSLSDHHFLLSLSTELEPNNFQEANIHLCQHEAMKIEVKALELNRTWGPL